MEESKKLKGLPAKLKAGIDEGKALTVSEWAEEFGVEVSDIRRALTSLRQRHGYHQYHPIGTIRGLHSKQGEIRDIMLRKEWVVETMDAQKQIYKDPQLIAFAAWLHKSYKRFPELRRQFKLFLSDEIAKLMALDTELKKKEKEYVKKGIINKEVA